MTARNARLIAFGTASLLIGQAAEASCVATTRQPQAQVKVSSGIVTVHAGRPTPIDDCEFEVVQGDVCAIGDFTVVGQPCRIYRAGERALLSVTNRTSSIMAIIVDHLQGEVRTSIAGKKLNDAEEIAGFPSGDVLMPAKDMLVPLIWVKDGPVTAFVLEDPVARTRISMPVEGNAIRIAHRHLAVGRTYKWQATIGGQNHVGSFTTVRPAEQVDLNEQLKQIAVNPDYAADPGARAVARAMVLYSEHFAFDALQEISGFVQRR